MNIPQLSGWIPIRLYWRTSQLMVDWCDLGKSRLTDPFFDQTIEHCLRHPFNLLFRHQTPIEILGDWQVASPGLPPAGFIFHMSRCGSTLISQMLASLSQNVVISEAGPIDSVLQAHFRDPSVTDERRLAWLQWMVSALGQRWQGHEKHYFIKFDSWHTLDLPLIKRAFPKAPWIFVYREPIEVIVSNLKLTAGRMFPGPLGASLLGLDAATVFQMQREEYCARVIAKFCHVALEHHRSGARLINYRQLPEVVCSSLLDFFQVTCDENERDRMRDASRFNAKDPSIQFVDDSAAKSGEASDLVRQMSDKWVKELYEQLEVTRQATSLQG